MTRFSFNYKTASGVGSLVLEKCAETFFKQFKLLGNSVQQETPSPEFPQEIKNVGKYNSDTGKYEIDVQITGKNLFNISDLRIGKVREDGYQLTYIHFGLQAVLHLRKLHFRLELS